MNPALQNRQPWVQPLLTSVRKALSKAAAEDSTAVEVGVSLISAMKIRFTREGALSRLGVNEARVPSGVVTGVVERRNVSAGDLRSEAVEEGRSGKTGPDQFEEGKKRASASPTRIGQHAGEIGQIDQEADDDGQDGADTQDERGRGHRARFPVRPCGRNSSMASSSE